MFANDFLANTIHEVMSWWFYHLGMVTTNSVPLPILLLADILPP